MFKRFPLVLVFLLFSSLLFAGTPPRSIPADANGTKVALQYYQRYDEVAEPLRYYQESTLRASAALVGATGRSNSTAITGLDTFTKALIYLDVTAMTRPDANETLDVVVETSHDGGTTWFRIARFTTVNAAGAQTQVLVLDNSAKVTPVADPDDTDPASGAISIPFFGERIRVASTYTDAANADGTSTFSVKAIFRR